MIFSADVYAKRREAFMAQLATDSVVLIKGADGGSESYYGKFDQKPDIIYLTGFCEPGVILVLAPGRDDSFVLFVRPKDKLRELWDGFREGVEGAKATYKADQAYALEEFAEVFSKLIENTENLYYQFGNDDDFDLQVNKLIKNNRAKARQGITTPNVYLDPTQHLHEMRLFKSAEEVDVMRQAAEITRAAHVAAMQAVKPGMYEYELEAEIEYVFRKNGACHPAYNSIVGAGANATILHYMDNNSKIEDGDLILIDAGCYYKGYISDVTRTFPANGKFNGPQKDIYEIVLASQAKGIDLCVPGVTWQQWQEGVRDVLIEGLLELGLLKGTLEEIVEKKSYHDFYMHNAGHWIGMDGHDVGQYRQGKEWRAFEAGMITTVEPGIYISATNMNVPEEFRGIGIRIEDEVLITDGDPDVITASIPKTIADMEAVCNS